MNELSIVAGGRHDFLTVRHLVVRGDQVAIGRALAEEAHTSAGWAPAPTDPLRNRARWTWFERNWPQQHARLSGVAAAFGLDPDDDSLRLDGFSGLPSGSGCSAVWCPPQQAIDGRGRVGRNYDFFTLSEAELLAEFGSGPAAEGGVALASRPYVLTTVPDDGLASTVLTMSELDGCTEGVNEAGLCVVLLFGDIEAAEPPANPVPQAGLDVMQVPRFLLDTCENAEQAKQALLGAKLYDQGAPCHYLVADAAGNAFVWERGSKDSEHIVEQDHGALCVTNHPLHRYPDVAALPEDTAETFETFARARTLAKHTAAPLSADSLREALDAASMPVSELPWRTLWRSVLDPVDRTLTTRFYLGDAESSVRHSPELIFEVSR
ncbi:C45 family peptidase [Prauserella cavernicola]|uniref:Peptidase C45, acyl-coenzyme A -6-aminopenicillanic acid acyl-transferase n=1 Tax=Prauserella cavernicola TaxID=2800127 RepID=A0A934QQ96_9PSEU|nr:C45 family peptidase [Prauserella cavernicola]MBK1784380.1 peptidase C45, acyl-coenzyme A - 6-aminopenicillanic acid acyl-transferase [Prauserella cavernicola]